jgi:hemerythrin-like domain-containing protein
VVRRDDKRTSAPDRGRGDDVSTDAIVMLKEDHARVKKLFLQFEEAGKNAKETKNRIVSRILEELTVHTYLENEVMYPEVRRLLPDLEEDVLESYEEHHVADVLCMELSTMDAGDDRFDAKTTVLIESVRHHIDEEERDWFPKVREALGRKELQDMGARIEELKPKAPRKPYQPSALKKALDALVQ